MTKFVFKLIVLSFFIGGLGNFANLQAQDHDVVADSVSIDDMDPVFITEEEEEEESSNGVMIAIVIVAVAAAGVGYKFIAKKKNK
jgi:hypothetical protein